MYSSMPIESGIEPTMWFELRCIDDTRPCVHCRPYHGPETSPLASISPPQGSAVPQRSLRVQVSPDVLV